MIIETLYRNTASKEGKPYLTKQGKPFAICTIKSDGDLYRFVDFSDVSTDWVEGMELDLDALGLQIIETEYQGKKQKEIKKVTKEDILLKRIEVLETAMRTVVAELKKLRDKLGPDGPVQSVPTDLPWE